MWASGFYRYTRTYTYRMQGKKIMQSLWTVVTYFLKHVEHGVEHDADSTYGVCIHYTLLNFTADSKKLI